MDALPFLSEPRALGTPGGRWSPRGKWAFSALLVFSVAVAGCGKSKHEIELEKKLQQLAAAHEALSKKLEETQKELDHARDEALEQRGRVRREAEEAKRDMAMLRNQLEQAREQLARAVAIRRAPRVQIRGRVGMRRPPGNIGEDYFATKLADAVGLSPVQRRHVVLLVRDTRNEIRRMWITARAAGASPQAFRLLHRQIEDRMRKDIEELLEGDQLDAYRNWEHRRHQPATPAQPRRANKEQMRQMRDGLMKQREARRRAGLSALAATAPLTPEQRRQLDQADQAEQTALKQLWAVPPQDAGQVLAKLERWQEIRQQTDTQLREFLNADQLDAYREWYDTQAAPRQTGGRGRPWWAQGRQPPEHPQDNL